MIWGNRVAIIQSKDLEAKGLLNDQSSALQIQGRWFQPGPAFTKSLLQIALEFCEDARPHGRQYLLVEFPTYFMTWRRIRSKNPTHTKKGPSTDSASTQTTSNPPPPQSSIQTNPPSSPATEPEGQSEPAALARVNRVFINLCKTELAIHIGPMADFLTEQTLNRSAQLTPSQLIEALAVQIPDAKAAVAFRKKMQLS